MRAGESAPSLANDGRDMQRFGVASTHLSPFHRADLMVGPGIYIARPERCAIASCEGDRRPRLGGDHGGPSRIRTFTDETSLPVQP